MMQAEHAPSDPLSVIDWVNLYAIVVSEENATGGRVVTTSTNDAAGIIPAVIHYYDRFVPGTNDNGVVDLLLTASTIDASCKMNVSISGAEAGCRDKVGVICSMAAGTPAAVFGGTPVQVENAAEIGMEHNLGSTCGPVGGLTQIPCIKHGVMASVKAANAVRVALWGDGTHYVSSNSAIKTMRETEVDMETKYKGTACGRLAVDVVEY